MGGVGGGGSRLAVDSLIGAYTPASSEVREDIVGALGRIGAPRGLPVVLAAAGLPSATWGLKIAAIHALEEFSEHPETVPALVWLLGDRERTIRDAALEALEDGLGDSWAKLDAAGRTDALLAVAEFLGDERSTTRATAAQILRDRLIQLAEGDARVREVLARCFREEPGPGLQRGGTLIYMIDMVLFMGFPALTVGVDRDMRRARVVAPENPWQPDEIGRIQAIIRSLLDGDGLSS